MKTKKTTIDSPAIEARKKYEKEHGPIHGPDKDCKTCKGKGIPSAELRAILACPKCYPQVVKPEPKEKKRKSKKDRSDEFSSPSGFDEAGSKGDK